MWNAAIALMKDDKFKKIYSAVPEKVFAQKRKDKMVELLGPNYKLIRQKKPQPELKKGGKYINWRQSPAWKSWRNRERIERMEILKTGQGRFSQKEASGDASGDDHRKSSAGQSKKAENLKGEKVRPKTDESKTRGDKKSEEAKAKTAKVKKVKAEKKTKEVKGEKGKVKKVSSKKAARLLKTPAVLQLISNSISIPASTSLYVGGMISFMVLGMCCRFSRADLVPLLMV
eukprot:gnl/MRDRNA2_/MRDRNA2_40713_c0_seq1.p1 gnl/MRDRNA2_/MRDRNA2_40713_c0~~gnl/MRDRNA2_/MRDRNA2_40713_c0_seq1.p1  ORF type:complete len:230 (+),score=54.49 gnl/MRDRNA2_/MRDRNA2_40713_c0_seq1:237-926(+)